MTADKLALLKESVSFTKSNEDALLKGEFEVHDDHIVMKISQRVALSTLVRPLSTHFSGRWYDGVHSILENHENRGQYEETSSLKRCKDGDAY
jgi:hypothetical protein